MAQARDKVNRFRALGSRRRLRAGDVASRAKRGGHPGQRPFLAPRLLVLSNPPWALQTRPGLQSAGPYVNAVATNDSWVAIDAASCAPPYAVELSYSFEATVDTLLGRAFDDAGALDAATQEVLERDLDDITASVGLAFTPYDNATMDAPNLVLLRNTNASTNIKHWGAEAPGYFDGVTSHVVYTEPAGTAHPADRLAGLGFALGLKTIGASGTNGYGLPVGYFGDTALSSVTASKDNACWPATRLGPLDLAFFAARHGVAPMLYETDGIELDATYGTGGLLLAPNGLTMLAATHSGQVTISLVDDGSSATHIGDSVILLAPGSRALGADASATRGAWIIGNNAFNVLTGSDDDDFFSPGGNDSLITTGLGADSLLLDDTLTANITVIDFNPWRDSIWVTPNAATAGTPALQITIGNSDFGAVVQTPNGATINLLNYTAADLPAARSWIFSGVPSALDPFKIDLCQGFGSSDAPAPAPASASASAPTSAPTPTPGAAAGLPVDAPAPGSRRDPGAIAGATIGACAGAITLGTLGWFYRQRRRLAANRSQPHNRFERFTETEPKGLEMLGASFGTTPGAPQ